MSVLVESDCMEPINLLSGSGECFNDDGLFAYSWYHLCSKGCQIANMATHLIAHHVARNVLRLS